MSVSTTIVKDHKDAMEPSLPQDQPDTLERVPLEIHELNALTALAVVTLEEYLDHQNDDKWKSNIKIIMSRLESPETKLAGAYLVGAATFDDKNATVAERRAWRVCQEMRGELRPGFAGRTEAGRHTSGKENER